MLWFVISIPVIIIGAAMITIGGKLYPKYEQGDKKRDRYYQIHVKGITPVVLGGIVFISMSLVSLISLADRSLEADELKEEYYLLTLTCESEEFKESSLMNKAIVYERIVDYNSKVEEIMHNSKSPWSNHIYPYRFWSKQDLKLIELE